jgi:hypothetical protein
MSESVYNSTDRLIGYIVDGNFVPLLPEPTREEIADAMTAVTELLTAGRLDYQPDPDDVREVVSRVLKEGGNRDDLLRAILALKKQRETAFTLGEVRTKHVSVSALEVWARKFMEPTPDNQARWVSRFRTGRAKHFCPECRYAGNDFIAVNLNLIICPNCGLFTDSAVCEREWSSAEWTARKEESNRRMEVERAAKQKQGAEKAERRDVVQRRGEELAVRLPETYNGTLRRACDIAAERTELSVDDIVNLWRPVTRAIQKMSPAMIPDDVDDFDELLTARAIKNTPIENLRRMLDSVSYFAPSELPALEDGAQRLFFTRKELLHEFKHNGDKWNRILDDHSLVTRLGLDGKFADDILRITEATDCLPTLDGKDGQSVSSREIR